MSRRCPTHPSVEMAYVPTHQHGTYQCPRCMAARDARQSHGRSA